MISKNDIIKMARRVFHHSQGKRRRQLMSPVRDWYIGLATFVLIAGAGSFWVWHEFTFYKSLSPVGGEIELELATFRAPAAAAAAERFRERRAVYDALVGAPPLAELPTDTDNEAAASDSSDTENESGGATTTTEAAEEEVGEDEETEVDLTQPLIGE